MIKELFKLLKKNTSDKGSFELYFNEHKSCYSDINYYELDEKELKLVDGNKDIYNLIWNKDTPVGNYDIVKNTIEEIYKDVKEICEERDKDEM